MRKWGPAVAVVLAAVAVAGGCTGADAKHAEALLVEAQAAQAGVRSETFLLKFSVEAGGMSGEFELQGGGYLQGRRAGEFYATMSGSGFPQAAALDFTVVRHGGVMTVRSGGRTESMSLSAAQSQLGSTVTDMSQLLGLERYVKSVTVDTADFKGRPADRIVGKIDVQHLLGSFGGAAEATLANAGVHVGDARVVLFVPRDTRLVEELSADVTIRNAGQSAKLRLSVALTSVDKPVSIPVL